LRRMGSQCFFASRMYQARGLWACQQHPGASGKSMCEPLPDGAGLSRSERVIIVLEYRKVSLYSPHYSIMHTSCVVFEVGIAAGDQQGRIHAVLSLRQAMKSLSLTLCVLALVVYPKAHAYTSEELNRMPLGGGACSTSDSFACWGNGDCTNGKCSCYKGNCCKLVQ
jgi:hypothetical protein